MEWWKGDVAPTRLSSWNIPSRHFYHSGMVTVFFLHDGRGWVFLLPGLPLPFTALVTGKHGAGHESLSGKGTTGVSAVKPAGRGGLPHSLPNLPLPVQD